MSKEIGLEEEVEYREQKKYQKRVVFYNSGGGAAVYDGRPPRRRRRTTLTLPSEKMKFRRNLHHVLEKRRTRKIRERREHRCRERKIRWKWIKMGSQPLYTPSEPVQFSWTRPRLEPNRYQVHTRPSGCSRPSPPLFYFVHPP